MWHRLLVVTALICTCWAGHRMRDYGIHLVHTDDIQYVQTYICSATPLGGPAVQRFKQTVVKSWRDDLLPLMMIQKGAYLFFCAAVNP